MPTVIEELRRRRIILPPLAVIERLCSEVRLRAERQTFRSLTTSLTEGQIAELESLPDPAPGLCPEPALLAPTACGRCHPSRLQRFSPNACV